MKKQIFAAALAIALAVPAAVFAHEGHVHKVMGTVTARHDNRVELKTQDGKTVVVTLDAKTAVNRGKQKTDQAAIKVGERVVVEIMGEKDTTAKVVTLAAARATARK